MCKYYSSRHNNLSLSSLGLVGNLSEIEAMCSLHGPEILQQFTVQFSSPYGIVPLAASQ